jgi:hypothetical protein
MQCEKLGDIQHKTSRAEKQSPTVNILFGIQSFLISFILEKTLLVAIGRTLATDGGIMEHSDVIFKFLEQICHHARSLSLNHP